MLCQHRCIVAMSIDGQYLAWLEPNGSYKTISMEIKMGASHVDGKAKLLLLLPDSLCIEQVFDRLWMGTDQMG